MVSSIFYESSIVLRSPVQAPASGEIHTNGCNWIYSEGVLGRETTLSYQLVQPFVQSRRRELRELSSKMSSMYRTNAHRIYIPMNVYDFSKKW